jgi:ribulose-phosphate 3-epimerase
MVEIFPSILAADFTRLGEQVRAVEAAGVTALHCDVMDGHFVPNLSLGVAEVTSLRKATRLTLDVHLMVTNPDECAPWFLAAGADCVSVHQEAARHLDRTLKMIQSEGAKAGVVLNPATPVSTLEHVLEFVDYVLLMSVNPGYGGQKLIPYVLNKARRLKQIRDANQLGFAIELDGGVTAENVGEVAGAGVDWIVTGSAIFGAPDPTATAQQMRATANAARNHLA